MRWVWLSLAFALVWLVGYLQLTVWLLLVLHPLLIWGLAHHMSPSHAPPVKRASAKPLLATESCHWLNHLIKEWMAVSSASLLPWIQEHVDVMLSQSLPNGIADVHLMSLDITCSSLLLSNINMLSCSTGAPPTCGHSKPDDDGQSCVLINANLSFDVDDDCAELIAHMGTKRCGTEVLLIIGDLHLYGCVQLLLVFDGRLSYPFVSMATVTFKEKPQLWFKLRILKGLEITSIPFLHSWLYHYIVDCFTESLVDPAEFTVNLNSKTSCLDNYQGLSSGVLTVVVMATTITSSQSALSDNRHHVISTSLGEQKRVFDVPINAHQFRNSVSFFVHDGTSSMLRVKVKRQGLLSNSNLAVHTLDLCAVGLLGQQECVTDNEEQAVKCYTTTLNNSHYTLVLTMKYTVLPSVSLSSPVTIYRTPQQVAGVITICVHSVEVTESIGSCDPYCVISMEGREVLVTDHQSDCSIAHWDKTVEVMTTQYSRPITFELLHWTGPLSSRNSIGYNKLSLDKEAQLVQHQLDLHHHSNHDVVGTMTVSVIFRPVDMLCNTTPAGVGMFVDDNVSLSSYDSRGSVRNNGPVYSAKRTRSVYQKAYKKISGGSVKGVVEFSILKGRNLVPMDTRGFSNPYIEVKFGTEMVYRSKVLKLTLKPEWLEHVSLTMPSDDEIITVTCWDKDKLSDDFMGSLQLTHDDFGKFKTGPKWLPLQMVATGELLMSINKLIPSVMVPDCYDNTSTVSGQPINEGDSVDGSVSSISRLEMRSYSDDELLSNRRQLMFPSQPSSETTSLIGTSNSTSFITNELENSLDAPITARYQTTTRDIEHALRQSPMLGNKASGETKRKYQATIIYELAGTVVQVDGLKGDLSNIELYVKIRLNYTSGVGLQRNHYSSRGQTIYKTRSIKGHHNPQWNEPFVVRDAAFLSNSLLTIDLKSGSKVNIGTHTITLEKFFEGSLKEMKWLSIGNDARLQLELSRRQSPTSRHTFFTSSPRRSSSFRVRKLTKTHKI